MSWTRTTSWRAWSAIPGEMPQHNENTHGSRRRRMHELAMPEWAKKVALERRGTVHPYENLDPHKTALIVVDLQNGFMVQDVAVAYVPMAVKIVPAVNKLAAAVRATGGKVFWIKNTFDVTNITAWSEYFDVLTPTKRANALANMAPDSR